MTLNLSYRLRRIFQGESGVVERVQPITDIVEDSNRRLEDKGLLPLRPPKDYFGNLPELVIFRNPLGELCNSMTPVEYVSLWDKVTIMRESDGINPPKGSVERYKHYEVGDKFP